MKKLIIAAAIVCAAVMSQAASVRWIAANVYDVDNVAKYTGSATLYAVLDGEVAYSTDATMNNGAISKVVTNDKIVGGSTYDFYYTMTDAAGNVFTSSTIKLKAQATSTANIAFAANGSWEPVPEPTSGLLLLLGVAGLALKRKRA